MDTFLEMVAALASDLNVPSDSSTMSNNGSSLFPIATLKLTINRAYRRAGGLFDWPAREDAKKTSTKDGFEYYDLPTNWRSDSVWRLVVDDIDYGDPLVFKDYENFKEDNPNSTSKIWANQHRRYFISPTPSENGSNNICIWGFMVVGELSADADETIFSNSYPECNDAIVIEAKTILQKKGENKQETEGNRMASRQAEGILTTAFEKIEMENAKYEKIEPQFNVPDFFPGNSRQAIRNDIGNFGFN